MADLPPHDPPVPVSTSVPVSFQLGTGASIYTGTLIPAILSAKHEIILVTCFWAPSDSLSALRGALEKLAAKRLSLVRQGHSLPPLRISLCLSSRSLLQKLLHTSSPDGYLYPPSSWPKQLGLPNQAILEAGGINLTVKSLFFLPVSVMHPKFLIIDRQRAFIPSCNISWEVWLEGCVEIRGAALADLLAFYSSTWDRTLDTRSGLPASLEEGGSTSNRSGSQPQPEPVVAHAHYVHAFPTTQADITTLILPSPHCRHPHFRPFPWQAAPPVPPTPLNSALLRLFDEARVSIYIQTPNLTSAPVISTLLAALQRGVNVTIVTSRNMMWLEQIVTAGTLTSWCIRSMIRRYQSMCSASIIPSQRAARGSHRRLDSEERGVIDQESAVEAQDSRPGRLSISYFRPREAGKSRGGEGGGADLEGGAGADATMEEPVHSHLKLTIADGRRTVLGSGNMDRASWYTSQELGVLFDDADFAAAVGAAVTRVLDGRLEPRFDSESSWR